MARPRYPSGNEPPPPALPPEKRTVGQLVGETLRLYGRTFLPAVLLGIPVAVMQQLYLWKTGAGSGSTEVVGATDQATATLLLLAFAPVFSLAFAAAVVIALDLPRPPLKTWVAAVALGTLAFLPAAPLLAVFIILAVLWLALVGLVVPVVIVERCGPLSAFRRALELARADYVHAAASIATLLLVFGLTRIALALVLRDQAENTIRVASALADLVLSPILFLGPALLYLDQAARARATSERGAVGSARPTEGRRPDAALPDADDAH